MKVNAGDFFICGKRCSLPPNIIDSDLVDRANKALTDIAAAIGKTRMTIASVDFALKEQDAVWIIEVKPETARVSEHNTGLLGQGVEIIGELNAIITKLEDADQKTGAECIKEARKALNSAIISLRKEQEMLCNRQASLEK
jgi:hypothetical protein